MNEITRPVGIAIVLINIIKNSNFVIIYHYLLLLIISKCYKLK